MSDGFQVCWRNLSNIPGPGPGCEGTVLSRGLYKCSIPGYSAGHAAFHSLVSDVPGKSVFLFRFESGLTEVEVTMWKGPESRLAVEMEFSLGKIYRDLAKRTSKAKAKQNVKRM